MYTIDVFTNGELMHVCGICHKIHNPAHGNVCEHCGAPLVTSVLDINHSSDAQLVVDVAIDMTTFGAMRQRLLLVLGDTAYALPKHLYPDADEAPAELPVCYHASAQPAPWSHIFWKDSPVTAGFSKPTKSGHTVTQQNKQDNHAQHDAAKNALYQSVAAACNSVIRQLPPMLRSLDFIPVNRYKSRMITDICNTVLHHPDLYQAILSQGHELDEELIYHLMSDALYSYIVQDNPELVALLNPDSDGSMPALMAANNDVKMSNLYGLIDPLTGHVMISDTPDMSHTIRVPDRLGQLYLIGLNNHLSHVKIIDIENGLFKHKHDDKIVLWTDRPHKEPSATYFTINAFYQIKKQNGSTVPSTSTLYTATDFTDMTDALQNALYLQSRGFLDRVIDGKSCAPTNIAIECMTNPADVRKNTNNSQ